MEYCRSDAAPGECERDLHRRGPTLHKEADTTASAANNITTAFFFGVVALTTLSSSQALADDISVRAATYAFLISAA